MGVEGFLLVRRLFCRAEMVLCLRSLPLASGGRRRDLGESQSRRMTEPARLPKERLNCTGFDDLRHAGRGAAQLDGQAAGKQRAVVVIYWSAESCSHRVM